MSRSFHSVCSMYMYVQGESPVSCFARRESDVVSRQEGQELWDYDKESRSSCEQLTVLVIWPCTNYPSRTSGSWGRCVAVRVDDDLKLMDLTRVYQGRPGAPFLGCTSMRLSEGRYFWCHPDCCQFHPHSCWFNRQFLGLILIFWLVNLHVFPSKTSLVHFQFLLVTLW